MVLESAEEKGRPQHEQRIGDDRAGDGRLDEHVLTGAQGGDRDDQFGQVSQRGVEQPADGIARLRELITATRTAGIAEERIRLDLSICRGLDYYTGTIYETTLAAYPELGSICSGGRYDDLASYFTDTRLPGVGISIGLTRLFSKLKEAGLLRPLARTPAEVLVTTMDARYLEKYIAIAAQLRAAGVNTEVYLEPAKLGNQLAYADRKGFRIAIIAGDNEFAKDVVQLKNLSTKSATDVAFSQIVSSVQTTLRT